MSAAEPQVRRPTGAARAAHTVSPSPPRPRVEPGIDDERLGLIEALLGAPSYDSLLVVGLDGIALAGALADRARTRTVMDVGIGPRSARAAGPAPDGVRRIPLQVPPTLPAGHHELVVVSEVLPLFGDAVAADFARALGAHRPCREILVVSPLDGAGAARDGGGAFAALRETLGGRFAHRELAVRRRYRIDGLRRVG